MPPLRRLLHSWWKERESCCSGQVRAIVHTGREGQWLTSRAGWTRKAAPCRAPSSSKARAMAVHEPSPEYSEEISMVNLWEGGGEGGKVALYVLTKGSGTIQYCIAAAMAGCTYLPAL